MSDEPERPPGEAKRGAAERLLSQAAEASRGSTVIARRILVAVLLAAACGGGKKGATPAAHDAGAAAAQAVDAGAVGVFASGGLAATSQETANQAAGVVALVKVKEDEAAAMAPNEPAITGEAPASAPTGADAGAAGGDGGDFKLVVEQGGDHALRPMEEQFLGLIVDLFNHTLKLPRDVPVRLKRCGTANMFYDRGAQEILVCDESLEAMAKVFALYKDESNAQLAALIALVGGFLHEMGHCLIHQYGLPVLGREEDAADQLAAILMLGGPDDQKTDEYAQFALTLAEFWLAFSVVRTDHEAWDEHSLDEQRYYNILCLTYGSSPETFRSIVDEGDLPYQRARRCKDEYREIRGAWSKLLAPHLQPGQKF